MFKFSDEGNHYKFINLQQHATPPTKRKERYKDKESKMVLNLFPASHRCFFRFEDFLHFELVFSVSNVFLVSTVFRALGKISFSRRKKCFALRTRFFARAKKCFHDSASNIFPASTGYFFRFGGVSQRSHQQEFSRYRNEDFYIEFWEF